MKKRQTTLVSRFLYLVERVGNALPHPGTLFALLAGVVLVLAWMFSLIGISAVHPATGELIEHPGGVGLG